MAAIDKENTRRTGIGYGVRLILTLVVFAAFFVWIIQNAYSIMIVDNSKFSKMASGQQEREITIPPKRGAIITGDEKDMAVSLNVESLYAHPHKIKDSNAAAKWLASVTGMPEKILFTKLNSKKKFVWLKRRLDPRDSERIKKLYKEQRDNGSQVIEGIGTITESKRFYPNGSLLSHVLGGMGLDRPLGGVEYQLDKYLKGSEIKLVKYRDARGRSVFSEGYAPQNATEGFSVKLTINSAMQYAVETELANTIEQFEARRGAAIIQEPSTGRILAIASYPNYDPNNFSKSTSEALYNLATNLVYEPGSTFKVLIMAAALNEGLVDLNEKIFAENGRFRIANRIIKDDHPYGMLTPGEIIQKSSNIGMSKVVKRLGRDKLSAYISAYGFGRRSGIELPGEERGLVKPTAKMNEVEMATMSFGQGISVTPVQLVTAISAIANNGRLMKPRLVDEIYNADGDTVKKIMPEVVRQVISPETAHTLTDMMVSVTEPGGTALRARIPGIKTAAKTGTAQKVDPKTRRYSKDKWISSLVAFVPADNPKFTVLVVVDEAKKAFYGGTVAGPAVKRIAISALKHYGLYTAEQATENLPATMTALSAPYEKVEVQGGVEIADDAKNDKIVEENGFVSRTPDFKGLTLLKAIKMASKAGFTITAEGSGVVCKQKPASGEALPTDGEILLVLSGKAKK